MSDDIVARLRDPSLGSPRWMDTMAEAADHIEVQAKRIAELEYFMKWLASVQNGSFYVDDQEYQVTITKTNGEPK